MLGALLVSSIVGEEGYLASIAAAREEAQLTDSLTKIRLENQFLQQDARRLETDPEAVETAARRLLHMIRPGETVIHLNDAQQPAGR